MTTAKGGGESRELMNWKHVPGSQNPGSHSCILYTHGLWTSHFTHLSLSFLIWIMKISLWHANILLCLVEYTSLQMWFLSGFYFQAWQPSRHFSSFCSFPLLVWSLSFIWRSFPGESVLATINIHDLCLEGILQMAFFHLFVLHKHWHSDR